MWRCVCLSTCHMCSTPPWGPVAGSTLTCSQNCASLSCTTQPFSGRMALAAPRRPSCRVSSRDRESIAVCVSGLKIIHIKKRTVFVESGVFVCIFARCVVSDQHANQWAGTFGGKLPNQGSIQGSVCGVSFWRQNKKSRWDWQIIVSISGLLFLSSITEDTDTLLKWFV